MLQPFLRAAQKDTAPTYVGGYTSTVTTGTADVTITFGGNLTGGLASSASEGDLVVVIFTVGSTSPAILSFVEDYFPIKQFTVNDDYDTTFYTYFKFMGSTPDTSFVVKYGTAVSGNGGTVAVQVWRNVDPRFIWLKKDNMPYATASTTSTARPDPPTLTPVYSKSIILAAGGTGHTRGASTFTSSDLSNFITIGANQTVDATVGLGSYTWTSGSFDPAQFGFSGSDSAAYGNCSVTLAIPPKNSVTSELNSIIATTQNKRTTSGTTLVLQKPASVQENDLMVMTVFDNGSLTRTMSATGWTSAYARAGSGNLTIFYKTAGASEPSSYTITSSGSAVLTGTFMAFRGYQWDTIGTANTTSSTSMTANSITVGANDSWLIGVASSQAEMLGVTGIGEPLDYVFNSVYDLVSRSAHTVTGEKVNSGTSPSTTYSFPASSNNMVILFSVKPV